jgi:hypothetical protein
MGKSTCCIVCAWAPGTCTRASHQSRICKGHRQPGTRHGQKICICTCARAGDRDPAAIYRSVYASSILIGDFYPAAFHT